MDDTTEKHDKSTKQSVPALTPTFRSQRVMNSNYQAPLLFPRATSLNENMGKSKSSISTTKLAPVVLSSSPSLLGITVSSCSPNQKRPAAAITPLATSTASIPELPSMHILERTCVTLDPQEEGKSYKVDADALVERIVEFLRIHSIAYTSEPRSGRMDCRTANRLSFVIQLWRMKKKGNDVLLMEVQRRKGCCIEMNATRRSLIQQVQQGATASDSCDKFLSTSSKRQRTVPPSISNTSRLSCEDALRISLGLIESRRIDQEELGWESLTSLTNPLYCSQEDAQQVSRAIVLGDGSLGARLQFELERIFYNSTRATEDRNVPILHHLALQTLANAMEQAFQSNSSSNSNNGDNHSSDFWQAVLEALLRDLEEATESPQKAAWSAKCLRLLLSQNALTAGGLTTTLDTANVQSLASKAFDYGKAHHLYLEQESSKLLQAITTSN